MFRCSESREHLASFTACCGKRETLAQRKQLLMNLLIAQSETPTRLWLRWAIAIIVFVLTLFAIPQPAPGVDPPPDGGYPNNNTAEGDNALLKLTVGRDNTAIGFKALSNTTDGFQNTAVGSGALQHNNGVENTAVGYDALNNNLSGMENTAIGFNALLFNTTGLENTAVGRAALLFNKRGNQNTATGFDALAQNTIGDDNTAVGIQALYSNTIGSANTATGSFALAQNTTGYQNTANGYNALEINNGHHNTASGCAALAFSASGSDNTAEGFQALRNSGGSNNIALGSNAGINLTTGSNNIDIGARGFTGESDTIRIGSLKQTATFIAGIRGTATANTNAVPVVIDSAGQLGTVSSSRRFKDQIKPIDNASEAIMSLKPVTFQYKSDTQATPQYGLIAEEVAKVNPDLVVRDEKGEIYTVRYDAVNAMLLNEFLKEHGQVQQLTATVALQQKQLEALTATVQKVSKQIETNKTALQVAAHDQ
jgi:Chaperone of endosialidase